MKIIFFILLFLSSSYCEVTNNITIDTTLQLTNENLTALELSSNDLNLLFGLSGLITSMFFIQRISKDV